MTPAIAVLTLLAVLLVFLPAAAFVIRVLGTRLLGRTPTLPALDPGEVEPLGALELGGYATAADLGALSARERRFVAGTVAPRLAERDAAAQSGWGESPAQGEREVPLNSFMLVCPACGASLGAVADVAHYVGSCPGCSRRVAARRRGSHVSLAAIETVRSPSRRGPRGRS